MKKATILVDWDINYTAVPKNEKIACVATGRTLEELQTNFEKSLTLHLKGMREDGEEIPEEFEGEYSLSYYLKGRALMHHVDAYITRRALSKETGINTTQLSHYAQGWRNPSPGTQEKIIRGIHNIGQHLKDITS